MYPHPKERKRVAIVGAGAAGMSATYGTHSISTPELSFTHYHTALSLSPDNFEVTLFERAGNCGGMATSIPIDASKYGAPYINDGVQGGSPVFHNTFGMFDRLGFRGSKVGFQISFGKEPGVDFCAWWRHKFNFSKHANAQPQGVTCSHRTSSTSISPTSDGSAGY
jgi:hypothetical protein